jgi:cytochrome d ubiquinol oxidase subunit I
MTPELLSRLQFALTASFHFIYPPISMGLGLLLVIIGIIYVRTGDPKWRRLSFFWVKIYALVFAMGIATGLVQEFEFGMNWANYSRYVGNIFGSLLAAEGIFAFFLEGGFLGLMLFGGNRLGPRMWLLSTFLVVFGAHFSALWILMANSWMQTPAGYELQVLESGREIAVMTSFRDVVFTPSFIPRLLHTWVASWLVGSSLILSISAWYLLKGRHEDLAKAAFKVVLPIFAVLAILQVAFFGPEQARGVVRSQEPKLAAMEGRWESESCAPMYVVGWVNESARTTSGLSIPCLLSFLAYGNFDATVAGLQEIPSNTWAPVNATFQFYHLMIDSGGLFVAIGLAGVLFYYWKRRLFQMRWLLWIFVFSIVLTEFATIFGWWVAELGRQPWIVWELLRTVEAGSPVLGSGHVWFSLGVFIALYAILFILFLFLLNNKIQHGPESLEELEEVPVNALPDSFREIFRRQPRAS